MTTRRNFLEQLTLAAGGAVLLKKDALARIIDANKIIAPNVLPGEAAFDESFWASIQSAFEVDRTIINFNNGGVSPSPWKVHHAFEEYLDYSNQLPAINMWQHLEPKIETVREKLAKCFGCDKEEIAITRNASESLENVQLGLDLTGTDEVLTTSQDYPRMMNTWCQYERRHGVKIKDISYPVPLINPDDFVEVIKQGITNRTKIIHLSHVVYLTGQILPIIKISRLAHERGILLICDGAHSFNHFPFTLSDLECDFFGTSLHKWTYAPIGTGMLYARKDLIPKVWPLMAAPSEMNENIRKFEEIGTHPAANHNAIAEALAFNEGIGIERKAARFRYLHKRWINKLRKYDNVKFMTNIDDESQWCGIINVYIEGTDVGRVVKYLFEQHRIYVAPIIHKEFQGIRVTPNVYTLLSEIDYFAGVMEGIAQGKIDDVMESEK